MEHEVEGLSGVLRDNEKKLQHWKKKIGGLRLHKIGRDEEEEEKEEEEAPKADAPAQASSDGSEAQASPASGATTKRAVQALITLEAAELEELDPEQLEYEIVTLEERIKSLKPDLGAIREYFKKEEEYLSRVAELDAMTEKRDAVRREHEALRKERLDTFMAGFTTITMKLKEMYQMITLGGDAELELVDHGNPFSEGIVFSVRPPKKSWKNIRNLSGGEKTLRWGVRGVCRGAFVAFLEGCLFPASPAFVCVQCCLPGGDTVCLPLARSPWCLLCITTSPPPCM